MRMEIVTERTEYEILSILDRKNRVVNAHEIERELQKIGVEISRRRVIQLLEIIDDKGFSENLGRAGREITAAGRKEVSRSMVHKRINFIMDQLLNMVAKTTFDLNKQKGKVVANLSILPEDKEERALKLIEEICSKTGWAQPFIKLGYAGEVLCDYLIPEGKVGLITISSVTVDGILLNNGIYIVPLYGGTIEFMDSKPVRFINLLPVKGTSFDPLGFFTLVEGGTTYEAAIKSQGEAIADYREVLNVSRNNTLGILQKTADTLGGLTIVGKPDEHLLGVPPVENYFGIVVFAGEMLLAALHEQKISDYNRPVHSVIEFDELEQICDVRGTLLQL